MNKQLEKNFYDFRFTLEDCNAIAEWISNGFSAISFRHLYRRLQRAQRLPGLRHWDWHLSRLELRARLVGLRPHHCYPQEELHHYQQHHYQQHHYQQHHYQQHHYRAVHYQVGVPQEPRLVHPLLPRQIGLFPSRLIQRRKHVQHFQFAFQQSLSRYPAYSYRPG
jgi:hypothetical protein